MTRKSSRYRFLKGYDHELEDKRQTYCDRLTSTDDKDIRKDSARGMASLTSLRSSAFVISLERVLGLRND